ncbi:FmdB family zinc ribbon protein [Singulisphaera sp. GP187]|uniref:FmdB family zinc ribbon protein n=1 Tax=Singulisphaera sp. GP187 TaxID=1882752 RepID=UPI00135664E2|nr:zinc ribbon domain-containing protein [Singulisphaera sp. GP187]
MIRLRRATTLRAEFERSFGTDSDPDGRTNDLTVPSYRGRVRVRRGREGGPAMPMYEFECADCSKTFDEKETFEEHDRHKEIRCPHCGGTNVHQLVTPTGVKTSKKS